MTKNNPAGRLYELAKKARSIRDDSPARLWALVFGIAIDHGMTNEPKLLEVVRSLMAFLDLIDETEAGVKELQLEDFYLEAFPPLRTVVFTSLGAIRATHTGLVSPFTEGHETLLRVLASTWGKLRPEPEVDESLLKEIRTEAHELFESVKSADINSDLKRLILSLASEIEQVIQQYRIRGPEGLKQTLALIQAQANLNMGIIDQSGSDPTASVWWNRLYKVAVKLYGAVKFASDTRKTIEGVSPFLRLLGAPDEIPKIDLPE